MEINIAVENAENVIQEGFNLFKEHWDEIAVYKDSIELSPDYDKYRQLEQAGQLHVVVARDKYDEMIGYLVSLVQQGLHYKNTKWAFNDLLYVSPEYRKGTTAIKLIKFSEQALKDDGVDVIVMRTKSSHDFSKLLERYGYECMETSYSKYIGE